MMKVCIMFQHYTKHSVKSAVFDITYLYHEFLSKIVGKKAFTEIVKNCTG